MKAERFRPAIVTVLVLLALSLAVRLYFVDRWKDLPTSDPYFFVAWASGISRSAHLKFPGSEDSAYGDYPSGYAMFMEMMSSASGIPILSLAKLLPLIIGSLCTLPVYLAFRKITPDPVYCAVGTGLVAFSFTFIKYTSVSIPNMIGLYFFPLAGWIALGRPWASKRMLAILAMTLAAVSRIHYLSLVCIGVFLAIVASRALMLRASGKEFDARRIAFMLIVVLVAGVAAWTAAYRIMWSIYGIDITAQPPARLSQATRLQGYPLIFGLVQTIAFPIGLFALASIYYASNFRKTTESTMDTLLLFATCLAFLVFASGFFRVEYYPFRFNSFLMLPMGMIGVLGLRYAKQMLARRPGTRRLAMLVVPVALILTTLQPVAQSLVKMDQGEYLLPWRQEYGRVEIPAMEWCQVNLLPGVDDGRPLDGLRQQILLGDWVRSRALRALGFEKVHLHWWFFQGVNVLTGEPNPFSGLRIYSDNITEALLLLGRLNLRSTEGLEEAYYYKYIYASDWIADLVRREFKREADFQKFDDYDGRYAYFATDNPEFDYVTNRSYVPAGYTRRTGPWGEIVRYLQPEIPVKTDILVYRLRPLDKVYSTAGAAVYDRVPLTPGYYTGRRKV